MKTCSKCRELLPFHRFDRDAKTKDGHRPSCKPCRVDSPERREKESRRSASVYKILRALGVPSEEASNHKGWSVIKIAEHYLRPASNNPAVE